MAIAHYYWNTELCRTFYPLLQAVEIALRNNLDRGLRSAIPVHRYEHIHSWLDCLPRIVVHPGAQNDLVRAKRKLLRRDASGQFIADSRCSHGDLIAALSFGFWVGLLESVYERPGIKGVYFWDDHLKAVFPGASGVSLSVFRRTFNRLRQFRNRVFHHEPIWQKHASTPTPKDHYDVILMALRWLGGEQAQIATRLHGGRDVLEGAVQVPLMQVKLLATIDTVLERARRKKRGKEARVVA